MTHGASDKRALSRCISAASFWTPIWVRPESEWLEHAPFGFWLTDALRPRTIVDLGTHSGYSLAVFCQAVQAVGLDCRCYGVDKWQDHTQEGANGEEIFRAISDHNEVYYKSFSSLIRSDFDQARAHFGDEFNRSPPHQWMPLLPGRPGRIHGMATAAVQISRHSFSRYERFRARLRGRAAVAGIDARAQIFRVLAWKWTGRARHR